VAAWLRLWVFNVAAPGLNSSRFLSKLFLIILITLSVPILSLPLLHFYFFDFYQTTKDFEVQCLSYPLANFQLLMISGLPCRCDIILVSFLWKIIYNSANFACIWTKFGSFLCMPNLKAIWLCVCILWQFFASVQKEKEKINKWRKWATFCRLIFQEWLARFTSGLACVLSQYPGTCTVNLVLFRQETTELQMHVESYFFLRVNILTLCTRTPHFLGPHDTLQCILVVIFYYWDSKCIGWANPPAASSTINTTSDGNLLISLSWGPPEYTGGEPVHYYRVTFRDFEKWVTYILSIIVGRTSYNSYLTWGLLYLWKSSKSIYL